MPPQLRIFVPPHPLIQHWLTIARDVHTPVPLFRTALAEMGKWLTYEAVRDWLPTQDVPIDTPLAPTTGKIIDGSVAVAIVPILRAGLALLEGCQPLLPMARVYHLGMVRDEATLQSSCYLNRLPERFAPNTKVLIVEPMLATGGTILQTLALLREKGIDMADVRIINIICATPALQQINLQFPAVQIYAACIDEEVNEQGWILPGLGDAGDRAFGT
jgi:uracil phosphoribosyltransferase